MKRPIVSVILLTFPAACASKEVKEAPKAAVGKLPAVQKSAEEMLSEEG